MSKLILVVAAHCRWCTNYGAAWLPPDPVLLYARAVCTVPLLYPSYTVPIHRFTANPPSNNLLGQGRGEYWQGRGEYWQGRGRVLAGAGRVLAGAGRVHIAEGDKKRSPGSVVRLAI
jgi:hypothetical protein